MRTDPLPATDPAANDAGHPLGRTPPQPLTREAGHLSWPPLASTDLMGFVRLVDYQLRLVRRQHQALAVLALRVGHLALEVTQDGEGPAEVNDETEAALLLELGRRLRLRLRAQDSVAWLGGRDFGVVLLCVNEAQARTVAARLSRVVGGRYCLGRTLLSAQVAVGVAAQGQAQRATGFDLVERAVEAMTG